MVTSLLSYTAGSGYGAHHDCKIGSEGGGERGSGGEAGGVSGSGSGALHGNDRMVTMLLYLNDAGAGAGGETRFPHLGNLTITPARGTMLLWFNLDLDLGLGLGLGPTSEGDQVTEHDSGGRRTERPRCLDNSLHEALPVLRGTKRVLQRWYHYGSSPDVHNAGVHTVCDASGSCREYCEAEAEA